MLGHARFERVAKARVGRDVALSLHVGVREHRQDFALGSAERERATERRDRFARARAAKESFTETTKEIGRGRAFLRVLDADAEHFFGLLHFAEMNARGATPAIALHSMRNGQAVSVGGAVIVRQRPGTAHGFVFLSLEDETGIANIIVTPDVFEKYRLTLVSAPFLFIEGTLQNIDGVVSVKANSIEAISARMAEPVSHDFR